MALPNPAIDSLRHFGKVIPSNSEETPSFPPQIADSVGNSSHPHCAICSLTRPIREMFRPPFRCPRSVSATNPCALTRLDFSRTRCRCCVPLCISPASHPILRCRPFPCPFWLVSATSRESGLQDSERSFRSGIFPSDPQTCPCPSLPRGLSGLKVDEKFRLLIPRD